MGLIERLIKAQEPGIPVDQFAGMVADLERGLATRAQIITAFAVQASEEAELDALTGKIVKSPDSISIGGHTILTNVGTAFDGTSESKGLGLALVQAQGVTKIEGHLRVAKVGTGTQSWQLWATNTDDTGGTEVFVVDDAGATGDKLFTGSKVFSPALSAGQKVLRVRCKSTVAADDPVFYGLGVTIYRASGMSALELRDILAVAEKRYAPLDTAAALRTRLGI